MTDEAQHNFTEIKRFMKFPTDEDLTGAAAALIRLQDTYHIDTSSLAKGELLGVKYTTQLSGEFYFMVYENLLIFKSWHYRVLF